MKETWKYDPTLSLLETSKTSISIWPNPTAGIIQFKGNEDVSTIEIYSALGELLVIKTDMKSIDISDFKVGVYYLKIHLEDKVIQSRVVKI